ncbi:MAG: hypothetical protein ACE5GH_07615 [Fidelibacterota bacterium]
MMKIEDTVNDVVLVILRDVDDLRSAGIGRKDFYARVAGYDEYGLWIQHPDFQIVVSEDEKGKPLPPDQVKRERLDATVHLPWGNIATLIHFPNRQGFDFPSPFERDIGFQPEEGEASGNQGEKS